MAKIDSALPSPRIVNGNIHWYENDEFELSFELKLYDADSNPITLSSTDKVIVEIRNDRGEKVKTFSFNNVSNNCLFLKFDSVNTALFKKGTYFYDIRLEGNYVTTVVKDNVIKVD